MRNKNTIILVIVGIILLYFTVWFWKETNYNDAIIPIFLMLLLGYIGVFFVIKTSSNNIDPNNIKIEKIEDKKVIVTYEEYKFETTLEYKYRKYLVPKVDMNGNKIGFIKRETLHNYLLKNYDLLSIPNNMIAITDKDVKKYFTNMTICTEENKNKYLNRRHFFIGYIVILIFILFNLKMLVQGIIEKEITLGFVIFFVILISIIVISYILRQNQKKQEENAEIYSCKVDIYDKKEQPSGEDVSYYVRVWNGDQHILNKWFNVDKKFYDTGLTGTLYLLMQGDKCYTDFEKGED